MERHFDEEPKLLIFHVRPGGCARVFLLVLGLLFSLVPMAMADQKQSIAILPLQNEGDPHYTLCEGASDFQRISDFVAKGVGKRTPDRDMANKNLIERVLTDHVRTVLEQKGYAVLSGDDIAEIYRRLQARGTPVGYKELQRFVPADSFLLVSIDRWEGDAFESTGKLDVSFAAYCIHPDSEENHGIVWSRKSAEIVQLEPNEFLFRKRQEEALEELARIFLKGFPTAVSLKGKK